MTDHMPRESVKLPPRMPEAQQIAVLTARAEAAEAALARRDAVIAGLVEAAKKAQEEVRQAFINAGVPPEKSAVIAHLKKAIAAAKEAQDE